MSEKKAGTGNVTSEEMEVALNRVHDKDKKAFVDGLKKIIRSNKTGGKNMFRVIKCLVKELRDCYMLKVEIEKFLDGKNLGRKWIKGYLTEPVKDNFITSIKAIKEKALLDTRDGSSYTIPMIINVEDREAPSDLDLDKLYDIDYKG